MKNITFFTGDITIKVHTATDARHVNKKVTLGDFAQGERIRLQELENGELLATCGRYPNERFIEGPQS